MQSRKSNNVNFYFYFANYKYKKTSWDNNINLGYGMVRQGKVKSWLKSNDNIELISKFGIEATKVLNYSALLKFNSQFSAGYNYPNDTTVISKFLAPGYILFAPGIDWKPKDYFSVLISPPTVRVIIVNDKKLNSVGAFGVDSNQVIKTEIGAYLHATFNKDLNKEVNLQTSLDLFSNYLDHPENLVVNWQMLLSLKVNKYISASLNTNLIYDDKVKLTFYKSDGVTIDHVGPGTQFKEVLGVGFAYKFSGVCLKK